MSVVIHPPLQFYAGDTWEIVWSCLDVNGQPLDLTGASIVWKLDTLQGQNILTQDLTSSISILQPSTGGQCMLTLPSVVSGQIPPAYYQDQLRVTTATGVVTTQASGRVQCLAPLS